MQMTIDIDDKLINEAQRLSGSNTPEAAIEQALKLLIQMLQQQDIRQLRGKLSWENDLEQLRQ